MSGPFTSGPWKVKAGLPKHPSFGIVTATSIIVAKAWIAEDATLIAAAPELYEALSEAVKTNPREDWIALLAKARGEA